MSATMMPRAKGKARTTSRVLYAYFAGLIVANLTVFGTWTAGVLWSATSLEYRALRPTWLFAPLILAGASTAIALLVLASAREIVPRRVTVGLALTLVIAETVFTYGGLYAVDNNASSVCHANANDLPARDEMWTNLSTTFSITRGEIRCEWATYSHPDAIVTRTYPALWGLRGTAL